jgi:hypothetical protein
MAFIPEEYDDAEVARELERGAEIMAEFEAQKSSLCECGSPKKRCQFCKRWMLHVNVITGPDRHVILHVCAFCDSMMLWPVVAGRPEMAEIVSDAVRHGR